jgi:amino acid transporter
LSFWLARPVAFFPLIFARIALVRIFSALAVVSLLLLAANFLVGLWIGDFNAAAQRYRTARIQFDKVSRDRQASESDNAQARQAVLDALAAAAAPRRRLTIHWFLGVASALVTMLVNSITITYFVGTSRWCKEVVETYKLPAELAERSAKLKRRTFPWAVLGMLTVLAIAALGATSDASTPVSQDHPQWPAFFVTWHYLAAIIGMLFVAWSFWVQYTRIAENHQVIGEILTEVSRVRKERGLPAEELSSA